MRSRSTGAAWAPPRGPDTFGVAGDMPEATVHIVDDDPALRNALTRLCRSAGLAAVAHRDPTSLPITRTREAPECILLDVRLTDQNGLTVQETLRDAGCTVPIIFLTGYGTIPMTVRAMRGGAVEFLTKPVSDTVLLAAIHRALDMDAATLHAGRLQDELSRRLEALTAREGDVLRCAIGGLMNKQIAAELGITEITAKVHKRRMMAKMGARSLADLVLMAHQLGIEATRQR
jgi:FixJ family two-component response regulator